VPNVSATTAPAFVTPTRDTRVMASAFLDSDAPKGTAIEVAKLRHRLQGRGSTGIKIDPKTGEMSIGWQIAMPPFDYDLGDAGKKVSDGWVFFTYVQHRARHRQARGHRLASGTAN